MSLSKKLLLMDKKIKYVGSVTKLESNAQGWDSPGESLDVLSIAIPGDLVVLTFSFDFNADAAWSWNGMSFTTLQDETGAAFPGGFNGYHFVTNADSNPYVTGVTTGGWSFLSIVASVFRNVSGFSSFDSNFQLSTSSPKPPNLTANGQLWLSTLRLDDRPVTPVPPSGYTLAGSIGSGSGDSGSTTGISYKIEDLSSDDPSAWTIGVTESADSTTMAFTGKV